jgi:hypothetical protein
LNALSGTQLSALNSGNFQVLSTTNLNALEATKLKGISTTLISNLTSTQLGGLSSTTVGNLTSSQVAVLNSTQLGHLTTANFAGLTAAQIVTLSNEEVAALTTDRIKALAVETLQALTTSQIQALTTTQMSTLHSSTIANFTTTQVRALATEDLKALTTTGLAVLNQAQVNALTTTQLCALTSTMVNSITTTNATWLAATAYTPIVLDLDSNGIQTLSVDSGVQFDLLANGQPVQTGWVGSGDGLLVMDRNNDGTINDGSELFGSSTVLADGSKAIDGYQALAQLDTNHDGVISSADAQFARLGVWVDGNADGSTGLGEVKSLAELNISQLSLKVETTSNTNHGNLIGLTSSYQTTDGVNHTAADVWFTVKPAQSSIPNQLAKAIGAFVDSSGAGNVLPSNLGEARFRSGEVLASPVQMVNAIRSFASGGLDVGMDSMSMNQSNAMVAASNLAVGLSSDEKVKPNLTIGSNLFVYK